MQPQAFLASVRDRALATLPGPLAPSHSRIRYGMLQLHYGDPRIHYEVWLVRKTAVIEVGLHFEADREMNVAHAEQLAPRALEFRESLGPIAELEQWSPSWTRLHVTVPLRTLDDVLSREIADKLATLVNLTGEQICALPERPRRVGLDQPGHRRHWHRRGHQTPRAG